MLREADLPGLLERLGVVPAGVPLHVEPAGDGNINWVRRVRAADGGRYIVKQARPRLERFPEYAAPTERILCERRWLEVAAPLDEERVCPEVLAFDEEDRVLVLADVGEHERLDAALARGAEVGPALEAVAGLLGRVHAATRGRDLAAAFPNDGMRRLHGDHIFVLPLRPNDFPLDAAVARRARELQDDRAFVEAADRAYARYLEPRGALVHADVQPANVLLGATGAKLLDAEIAHVGDPAFDVGTLLAHVWLAGVARGEPAARGRAAADARRAWTAYTAATDAPPPFADVARYAGLEGMRRTIGAARVPAVADPAVALAALELARSLVLAPPPAPDA